MSIATPALHNLMVFRIEHIHNLEYILRHGMFTRAHAHVNPDHVFIGHAQLTEDRHEWPVIPIDSQNSREYGTLGQYVPFYFGPRSPMLYVIQNGYNGVPKRHARDIVYLCCRVQTIAQAGVQFVFTDGHAKNKLTAFYSNLDNLSKLFWQSIYARKWKAVQDDLDRERRKQAEMLVPTHVPPHWIEAIVVYDEEMSTFAENLKNTTNHKAKVRINPSTAYDGCGFYF